jgi:carbonic anhydrase
MALIILRHTAGLTLSGVGSYPPPVMPEEEGPPVPADPAVDPNRLLPARRTFYHYEGSLTTPCSQSVDWLVLTHHIEATEADIARFARLYPMNARPVQRLDRGFILISSPR